MQDGVEFAHYRDCLEGSSDGFVVLRGSTVIYLNLAFARSVDRDPQSLVGAELQSVVQDRDHSALAAILEDFQNTVGLRDTIDLHIRTNQGEVVLQAALHSCALGQGHCIIANTRDMTAERELQRQLSERRLEEHRGTLTWSVLSRGMAHNMLNTLTLLEGQLREGMALNQIDAPQGDELARNVADLRYLAERLQRHNGPGRRPEKRRIDLAEALEPAFSQLRTAMPGGIELRTEVPTGLEVRLHQEELREVVINLVVNARDACEGKGTICVKAEATPNGPRLAIEDNGPGIPQELQRRMFEPFFSTKGEGGSGLGLSMCRWLCLENGVELNLDENYRDGARFVLHFSTSADEDSASTSTQAPKRRLSEMQVLIVDDDDGVRRFSKDLFDSVGCEVFVAAHPSDALKLLDRHDIALLLTDLDLPGLSGWGLARHVKTLYPTTLVGLMTGWDIALSKPALRARGVEFALRKPFELEALESALADLSAPT